MKKMILLFSHKLTQKQIEEAKESLDVQEFLRLPTELQAIWSAIPADEENITSLLAPIKKFLSLQANRGDLVLIQGDFGAVYHLVSYAKELNLKPLYATTQRRTQEYINEKGENVKKSIFEHRRFREYE